MAVQVRIYVDGRVVELEVAGPLAVFTGGVKVKKQGKGGKEMGARTRGSHRREAHRMRLDVIEREGRDAFGAGVPLSENPYPDGGGMAWSGRHARWHHGWRMAEWQRDRPAYEASRCSR